MLRLIPLQSVGIAFFLVFFLLAIGMFALWVWVSYWVYTDAEDREMDSAALWGVVTFIGGVFGFVAYILIREDP